MSRGTNRISSRCRLALMAGCVSILAAAWCGAVEAQAPKEPEKQTSPADRPPPWQRVLKGEDARKVEALEKQIADLEKKGQFAEAVARRGRPWRSGAACKGMITGRRQVLVSGNSSTGMRRAWRGKPSPNWRWRSENLRAQTSYTRKVGTVRRSRCMSGRWRSSARRWARTIPTRPELQRRGVQPPRRGVTARRSPCSSGPWGSFARRWARTTRTRP